MALQTGQFGILFERQTSDGVLASALQAIYTAPPGAVGLTDGAVFGDASTGVGSSGIDLTLGRSAREASRVSGGDTRLFDEFLAGVVNTFQFSWVVSGPKWAASTPPVDGDFQHGASNGGSENLGIGALLKACGLGAGAAWAGGVGWEYKPAAIEKCSALVFDSGALYALVDCQASLEMAFTPGEAAVFTATFRAKLDTVNPPKAAAFPTFDYGDQDSVAAPTVAEANNAFGQSRGFSDLTVVIDNLLEETPDSNESDGVRLESNGRDVTVACTLDVDDAAPTFDVDELLRSVASGAADMTFGCGASAGAGENAVAYDVQLANLNLQDVQLARPLRAKASTFNAFATAETEGDEFSIVFR